MTTPDVDKRAEQYLKNGGLTFSSCLGVGTQGSVFVCNLPARKNELFDQVAIKFHDQEVAYHRELGVYLRLRDLGIEEVGDHMVPQLIDYNDELLAIEMTIVSPPFCLDFGGAYLDRPPDYSPEVWADWRTMKSEAFESNWPAVEKILAEFKSYGIYIADVTLETSNSTEPICNVWEVKAPAETLPDGAYVSAGASTSRWILICRSPDPGNIKIA